MLINEIKHSWIKSLATSCLPTQEMPTMYNDSARISFYHSFYIAKVK